MFFKTIKKTILSLLIILFLASCGDSDILSLFNPNAKPLVNQLGQTLLTADFFAVIGTSTGVIISTNQSHAEFHSVADEVISVTADSYGNIYYTLNLQYSPNCAISTDMFATQTIDSYTPNNYSLALACDNHGYSYSLQAGATFTFNQSKFNRGTDYLNTIGYMNSSSGLGSTIKTALAVNSSGILVIGNVSGSIFSSIDHGDTFTEQVGWSGTALSNIAISPNGIVVINHIDQLQTSNNSYATTITTGTVTSLAFAQETLYIGMDNGSVGISFDYGQTIITNSSIGSGRLIAVSETRTGNIIAITANGTIAEILIATNSTANFTSVFSTNTLSTIYDAAIVF